jgi:hypothetical protein
MRRDGELEFELEMMMVGLIVVDMLVIAHCVEGHEMRYDFFFSIPFLLTFMVPLILIKIRNW